MYLRPRVFLKVAGMNKGASDFDAIYTEVDEMLNLGLKLVQDHIPPEGDAKQELTDQLMSVGKSLEVLFKQRAKEQAALQKVMVKAKAWKDPNKKFDARKELQAILDNKTMGVDITQDQAGTDGKEISQK